MKISNTKIYGIAESIIASGYPMSTKTLTEDEFNDEVNAINYALEFGVDAFNEDAQIKYEKVIKRIKSLGSAKSGSGHDCALKGMTVQTDIKAPEFFWRQWDRYHHTDYISSQSKMHKITKLDLDEICNEYVLESTKNKLRELIRIYNDADIAYPLQIETQDETIDCQTKEELFKYIVSNIPSGLELTARITTNYLQLKTMYNQRNNHKMYAWREILCPWILSLPHFKEFTGIE